MMMMMTGAMKLMGAKMAVETRDRLTCSKNAFTMIGFLELMAAAGLLIGFKVIALGIAASGGIVLLLMGALITHLKAKDTAGQMMMPLMVLMIAVATLITTIAK